MLKRNILIAIIGQNINSYLESNDDNHHGTDNQPVMPGQVLPV